MENLLLISTGGIIAIAVVFVMVLLIVIFVGWYISTYNGLVTLRNLVEEGWATIDVQLKKRYDLIPNLVETVKGYAKHEKQTLEAVISARNAAMTATDRKDKMAAENVLTGTLKTLFALQEDYPNLKANVNFTDLQNQLRYIEDDLVRARRYYNGTVKTFNTKIELFPSSIIARHKGFERKEYFELESAEERRAPKVQF